MSNLSGNKEEGMEDKGKHAPQRSRTTSTLKKVPTTQVVPVDITFVSSPNPLSHILVSRFLKLVSRSAKLDRSQSSPSTAALPFSSRKHTRNEENGSAAVEGED